MTYQRRQLLGFTSTDEQLIRDLILDQLYARRGDSPESFFNQDCAANFRTISIFNRSTLPYFSPRLI